MTNLAIVLSLDSARVVPFSLDADTREGVCNAVRMAAKEVGEDFFVHAVCDRTEEVLALAA